MRVTMIISWSVHESSESVNMVNLVITGKAGRSVEEDQIELVERKGKGHPDSLADGIAEEVSRNITLDFRENEEMDPYHFSDKVFIVGGKSLAAFGNGKLLEPFEVNLVCVAKEGAFAKDYLENLVEGYLERTLHEYRPGFSKIRIIPIPASEHTLTTRGHNPLECDDTSLGVAFAPLTESEKIALQVEHALNGLPIKGKYPMVGEDIKVMAYRNQEKIFLTIACAFISKYIGSLEQHRDIKLALKDEVLSICRSISTKDVSVEINPDDRYEDNSVYLTVMGSSIEHGDCGISGRGNRIMGINSANRPMCIETVPGKLWLHPGKLYNLIARNVAEELANDLSAKEVNVRILGKVGEPVSNPEIVHVEINPPESLNRLKIDETVKYWFENLDKIKEQVLSGRIELF
jgi:S-adenosylmethionine synthetase